MVKNKKSSASNLFLVVFVVVLFFVVWLWAIPAKIKSDTDGHVKYLKKHGYDSIEMVKVNPWALTAFYSVYDTTEKEKEVVKITYSRNGVYNIRY